MDEYDRREFLSLSLPSITGHKDIFEAEVS
jgi:hypothetical protein